MNFVWPFFGFTERTSPYRYSEQRYFWPFFVQGRGDDRYVNRWGPFYTHSVVKGNDSHSGRLGCSGIVTKFADDDLAQKKTQLFYFVYRDLDESSLSPARARPRPQAPRLAPSYKGWDNGAAACRSSSRARSRSSFPRTPTSARLQGPLFSLYRYDHLTPRRVAWTSLLWNAVTWRYRTPKRAWSSSTSGPILGMASNPAGNSWTILGIRFRAQARQG